MATASSQDTAKVQSVIEQTSVHVEVQKLSQDQLLATLEFVNRLQLQENQELEAKEADITQQGLALINSSEQSLRQRGKEQSQQSEQGQLQEQVQEGIPQ